MLNASNMTSPPAVELQPFKQELAVRAADARGRLTTNDERVLEHLQGRTNGLAFQTSDSLAQSVGVSRAAVVRFARKLGYAGFTELRDAARHALRQSQESPLSRFSADDPESLRARKVIQDNSNIVATQELVSEPMAHAANAVASAQRVFILGSRKSYGLAVYLHRLLADVRSSVRLIDPGFPDELAGVGAEDAVITCLFRRYARLTIDLMASARGTGAKVVLLTDGRGHEFAADVDHLLIAVADSPALYDSMVAPMWALESLVTEVAAISPQSSRSRLETVEHFTDSHRLLLD